MFEDCSAALIGSNESTWLGRCIAQGELVEVQLMEEGHGQGGIEMLSTNRWKRWLPSIPNDGFSSERCLLHVISYAVWYDV